MVECWIECLMVISVQVKVQCQKGIPASLRAKCWSLLSGASEKMEQNKNLYEARKMCIICVVQCLLFTQTLHRTYKEN